VCGIPVFSSHLRKVRISVTASRALCIRVSSPPAPFPPSEGVRNPRVFASSSEGAQKRHCIESTLYPCFFSPCTFPTFGRCAESPCFRLTFGRCAEASLHRECPVSVFLLPLHLPHLRKECRIPAFPPHLRKVRRIPVFSPHLRKVRRSVTASRVLCIRVSSPPAPFPPSEGVRNPCIFASPSEGAQKRHCIESALYPCFFSPCTFPTFGRCAEASLHRECPVSVFLLPLHLPHLMCYLRKECRILAFSPHLPKVRRSVMFLCEYAKYRQYRVEWGSGKGIHSGGEAFRCWARIWKALRGVESRLGGIASGGRAAGGQNSWP